MKMADLTPSGLLALAGLVAAGAVAFYVVKKGGLGAAASAAGAAAVGAAVDLTSGAVGEIGATVGLPRPSETTTDAGVARWIIDHPLGGYLDASMWASAGALASGLAMDSGSGRPPPAGSDLAARFPGQALDNNAAPGGNEWSLGGWVYDLTHADPLARP